MPKKRFLTVQGINIEDIPDEHRKFVLDCLPINGGNCVSVELDTPFGQWLHESGFVFKHGLGSSYVWEWIVIWR